MFLKYEILKCTYTSIEMQQYYSSSFSKQQGYFNYVTIKKDRSKKDLMWYMDEVKTALLKYIMAP